MTGLTPLQIVWNWPLEFLMFLVYLSYIVVGWGILFLLYTAVKELKSGTVW